MISYRKILIFVCFVIVVLFSGCTVVDTETIDQIKYNYSTYEGVVQEDGYYTKFVCTSTDRVEYYFEEGKYSESERANFINDVETLCNFYESDYEISFKEPISIYVSDNAMFQGTERKIFMTNLDVKSINSVVAFLQAMSDYNANYGLCYGIGCYVSEKLYGSLLIPSISEETLGKYYANNPNMTIMDLTIPVFQTIYFTEEENKYAYSTAYYFVKDLIERKGLKYAFELLAESTKLDISFDKKYADEKNIWLKKIGATKKCEALEVPIRYELKLGKNTKTYPYVIYTPSTISYIIPNEKFEHGDIVMDYEYIKHYFTIYEQDILALKKYFAPYFDTKKDMIPCYFSENTKGKSWYKFDKLEYSAPLLAGAHEYAHYITYKDKVPTWLIEGTATYAQFYLEGAGIYRMVKESLGIYDNDKRQYYGTEFTRLYAKNLVDVYETTDELNLSVYIEVVAYLYNVDKSNKSTLAWITYTDTNQDGVDLSYSEAASLVNYLIKTYGEEKYFKLFNDYTKLKDIYGKTFEELKLEWQTQLRAKME